MTDTNGNGNQPEQRVPLVGGIPVLSSAVAWSWSVHDLARDPSTGEAIKLLRFMLPTGPLELWAPASFIREMAEKLLADAAGLHIASEIKPPTAP